MRNTILSFAATFSLLVAGTAAAGTITVDPKLPAYQKVSGISGNLNSIGSDTLNNLMTLWAEGFQKVYPNVRIQIEGKGSSTAPPALIEGTAQLGPMSRPMKSKEMDAFEKQFGFKPASIGTSLDSLAVYVNKDNPIKELSIEQVDAVFSKNRKCGEFANVVTWGDLGLKGSWGNKPVSLYGRNSASGTYGYFKKHALCKGDYKDTVKEQPGSSSVVNGVANDLGGIGYSGIGYKTSGVKAIALSPKGKKSAFLPNYDNVLSKKYPLGRQLFVYFVAKPGKKIDPLTREFLKYILSKEGQQVVVKDGYLPLPAKLAAKYRAMLK